MYSSGWPQTHCPCLPLVAVINAMTKSNLGGKGLFHHTLCNDSLSLSEVKAGDQGRNLNVGTEAETMEEHSLLNCFSWAIYLAYLDTSSSLPRDGTDQSELDPPPPVSSQDNALKIHPKANMVKIVAFLSV